MNTHFPNSNHKAIEISVPNCSGDDQGLRSAAVKEFDVATLGDLCVDIVLNVPQLPPASIQQRKAYMEQLLISPPPKEYCEAGGTCNMSIAATRLGLCCNSIGHVGGEIYGRFLLDVLHDEGIGMVQMSEDDDGNSSSDARGTYICWVFVDPLHIHDFCSPADFSKEPAFSWISKLSTEVKMALKKSKILYCDGYVFNDFLPGLIVSAVQYAVEVGTSMFFDPGPRGQSLSTGTTEEQRALGELLRMSDVLLLTSEEAESLTGIGNPILAGQELLTKGVRTKWVIIKMGDKGSILITKSCIYCAPAFKVNVVDTVGCGDSFAAAIAFGFIHNLPLIHTLTIANAVGAATATGSGAGRNVATLKQVIELMRAANLSEDDTFWNELLDQNLDAQEITFLSKMVVNGEINRVNHVPLQEVVSAMLPKLESGRG